MTYYPLICIICALFFTKISIQAQEGMIKYRQVWNLQPGRYYKNNKGIPAYLYFKDDRSLYVYNRLQDITAGISAANGINEGSTQINVEYADDLGNMFYKDFKTDKLQIRQLIVGNAFISEEPMPSIQWKILPGEKDIGIFHCKKAGASFRGRDYEAWFAPEIPLKNGPWKLHGLPGLIMEVYDKSKEVYFLAESVSIPYNTESSLLIPRNGKLVSLEEFKFIEISQSRNLLDSLSRSHNIKGTSQIRLDYYPIEKSFD